jgi:S-adenosylmethionine:tRNA ribosyltransferase-isomerase
MMNKHIDINNYDYDLPDERIAKYPLKRRDHSKLLYIKEGVITDHHFCNIPDLLPQNATLFYNNTKVLYARLPFQKATGASIEIFCLEPSFPVDYAENLGSRKSVQWKCIVGNLKKWKEGKVILKNDKELGLSAEILERNAEHLVIKFDWNLDISFAEVLEIAGEVPIPPYLNRNSEENDKQTYQTLYSKIEGSVAAPTAGLHFTDEVFQNLRNKSIEWHEVTLHVGAGTFKPVDKKDVREHKMHQEFITVKKEAIQNLLLNLNEIIAVGTTTVRTLESLYWIGAQIIQKMPESEKFFHVEQWEPYQANTLPTPKEALEALLEYLDKYNLYQIIGNTEIIIVPGYKHKIVKGLITNFHQPKSTLLLLLASFVGNDWKKMYSHALSNNYRFLSYGDSCLIL